jgi:hypothetical protein
MNKLALLLFLIALNIFSQKNENLEFSISEIDSISKNESCLIIYDFGGKIEAQKATKNLGKDIQISGIGYFSIKPHSYLTEILKTENLSKKELRNYNEDQNCKLIRADYDSEINFEDGTFNKITMKFYYNKNQLFYVKYQEQTKYDKVNENEIYHNFFFVDFDKEFSKNEDLKKWILNQNTEIVKKCVLN